MIDQVLRFSLAIGHQQPLLKQIDDQYKLLEVVFEVPGAWHNPTIVHSSTFCRKKELEYFYFSGP